jgi:hypothetical protein
MQLPERFTALVSEGSTQEHVIRHEPTGNYCFRINNRMLCKTIAAYRNRASDDGLAYAYVFLFSDLKRRARTRKSHHRSPVYSATTYYKSKPIRFLLNATKSRGKLFSNT